MSFFSRMRIGVRNILRRPVLGALEKHYDRPDAASQLSLQMQYRSWIHTGAPLPGLREVGFQVYSQSDEDGILLFLFSLLQPQGRRCIEICAGNGIECNTANLIINRGWAGLLVDGNQALVEQGREFYQKHRATYVSPPVFEHAWITRDNVNVFLKNHKLDGEIDLLSLDLDGMDYWIWEAMDVISPRIVVLEFNPILGPERSVSVPYLQDFNAYRYPTTDGTPNYFGASLQAFVKLAGRKGYRLIGSNRWCYNAFFVKKDLLNEWIPSVTAEDCFRQSSMIAGLEERFLTIRDLTWVEI